MISSAVRCVWAWPGCGPDGVWERDRRADRDEEGLGVALRVAEGVEGPADWRRVVGIVDGGYV